MPTFFHGSTLVRASSLGGSFSGHTANWRAALCCVLFVYSVHGVHPLAHANEIYLHECLFHESSGAHLVVSRLPSL
jgi:hypothetical protein